MAMNTPRHTVKSFDEDLETLSQHLADMASKVRLGYARAITALMTHNVAMAEEMIKQKKSLNVLQLEVEKLCFSMLALRQPVAMDLRYIVTAINISSHLKRIGSDTKNICRRVRRMKSVPKTDLQSCMRTLAESGQEALDQLEALIISRSAEDAVKLHAFDDVIDDYYADMYADIIEVMRTSNESVPEVMHVLFAAKNIERLGDRCTDIADLIYYQNTSEKL